MEEPKVVRKDELRGEPTPTPGVTRFEAFAGDSVWVGRIENAPDRASGWHVHPGHDTYGHVTQGRFFVEFGFGGSKRVELEPGDFVLIPKGVVHREGNPAADTNDGVIVRVGDGALTVVLDGPESG